jgi:serine/threonine protein kinase
MTNIQIDYKTYSLDEHITTQEKGKTYLGHIQRYDAVSGTTYKKKVVIKMIEVSNYTEEQIKETTVLLKRLQEISGYMESEEYMVVYLDWSQTVIEDKLYIVTVTEFIEGYDLETYFANHIEYDYNTILSIMSQIAKSLDYLHTYSIAHQNIKPSNIYYDENVKRWKLIDYVYSCSDTTEKLCNMNPINRYTLTPEAAIDNNTNQVFISRLRQDIWSLGVVFYAMVNNGEYIIEIKNDIKQSLINIAGGSQKMVPSRYTYQPINSIIMSMLNTEPEKRPTSGQVVFLIYLARPGCKVDDVTYSHDSVKTILYSLGIEDLELNDYKLCSKLTNNIRKCPVNKNMYMYDELIEFSKIIGLKNRHDMNIDQLCQIVNTTLQTSINRVKEEVTSELIRAIQYRAIAETRKRESKFTDSSIYRINNHFDRLYKYSKENNLIDINMLEKYRIEIRKKYDHLKSTASVSYATVFGLQNDYIIHLILEEQPDYEYNRDSMINLSR